MKLKEFIEEYGMMYDDFGIIVAWAEYNHYEAELIKLITEFAEKLARDKSNFERRVKEWSYYAYVNLSPEITKDLDFTRAINMVRLIHLSYTGKQFVEMIDKVLVSRNIKIKDIKGMHSDIYNKYMKIKGE